MKINTMEKGLISIAAAMVLSSSVYGAVLSVTTLVNEVDNNCTDTASMSLSDAMFCSANGDVIDFNLTGVIAPPSSGLSIDKNITISGPGHKSISFTSIINPIFTIPATTTATISGMTINNVVDSVAINNAGNLTISDSNVSNNTNTCNGDAAGVINTGSLTISQSTLSNNTSNYSNAAAINNTGILTISDSNISNNTNLNPTTVVSEGGSAGVTNTGSLTITNSNFYNNKTYNSGAAIHNSSTLELKDTSFFDNNATIDGGAIFASFGSNIRLFNTTISGNGAIDSGGGIYTLSGDVNISDSTIAYNTSGSGALMASGGGIYNSGGNVNIKNTIIAKNIDYQNDGPDIFGTITSYGYNLITTDQNASITYLGTDINGSDPLLNPLGLGNSTYFHTLQSSSPVIDAGICTDLNGNTITADQNSVMRPQGSTCEIGAIEYIPLYIYLNLSNVSLIDHNITSINVVGVDGNSENLVINPGYTYIDGDNNISSPIYNVDQNISIRVDTNSSGLLKNWWVNFSDGKLYQINNSSNNFKVTIGNGLHIFNFDAINTNFIANNAPTITQIYDQHIRPGYGTYSISFDINDTESDDVSLSISTTNTDVNLSSVGIAGGNGTASITITTSNTISNNHVSISANDGTSTTTRGFNLRVSNNYDIISTQEAVGSVADFNGTLYFIDSYLDHTTSQELEVSKLEIVNSTNSVYTEIKDINGTVTVSTQTQTMPATFQYDVATINNSTLTSMYSANGTPFSFADANSTARKVYVTYTSDYLDPHHIEYGPNGTYTTLDTFMANQVKGKTTYGIMRNYAEDKLLLLDDTDLTGDIANGYGNLIEVNATSGLATGNTGKWSIHTVNTIEILDLNTSLLSGYNQNEAYMIDASIVKGGDYAPSGSTYSYALLNKTAKDEIYYSVSPNPKIAVPLVSGYTYVSLANTKSLCNTAIQSLYTSLCDQNNTLESTFGSNSDISAVVKYEEGWTYWDSNASINTSYLMNKFLAINTLNGMVVKTSAATILLLPYDDDAKQVNDYVGMSSAQWYLLSNNKTQTLTELIASVSAAGKAIEYIAVFRAGVWHIYAPLVDSSIDSTIPRITEIKRHESYWITFQ